MGSAGVFPDKSRRNRKAHSQKGKDTEESAKSFSDKNWGKRLTFYTRQISALDDKAWKAVIAKATQLCRLTAKSDGEEGDDADRDDGYMMYSDPITVDSGSERAVRTHAVRRCLVNLMI